MSYAKFIFKKTLQRTLLLLSHSIRVHEAKVSSKSHSAKHSELREGEGK